ncbi:MAG: VWA domain-containing protein [Actinomycetia bacterium]|nr:VWA domain-containing protein [Actinomycetes bacterium]MCP4222550.1 VWA domain-containing protein [Actinomycetes bacterium]
MALLLGFTLIVAVAEHGSAQESSGEIQILDLSADDTGTVTFELALPAEMTEVAPTSANFTLTENGDRRDVEIIPLSGRVDVVIALDTSGSMAGDPIEAAKQAAAAFIESLPSRARVGIVSFGSTVEVAVPPGQDRSNALEAVAGLQAEVEGGTALWDALGRSAQLVAELGAERPYVVVLTDGVDEGSRGGQSSAVAELSAAGAGLYAIAVEGTDIVALEQVASAVGGQVLEASEEAQFFQLYDDIASRLANRYTVRYQSNPVLERVIVIAVASGDAVATARTVVSPSVVPEPEEPLPQAVDEQRVQSEPVALPVLDPPEPGLFSRQEALVVGIGAFFLTFLLIGVIISMPASGIQMDVASGADRVAAARNRLTNTAESLLQSSLGRDRIDRALDLSGINLRSGEFAMLTVAASMLLFFTVSYLSSATAGGLFTLSAVLTVVVYLKVRVGRRRRRFADQMTDALGALAGTLRAGQSLLQAIEYVAHESPSPTSSEFRRIVFETRIGRDMTDSMEGVAERMASVDFQWVADAVDINREVGGDLTEVLDNVSDTIRDRQAIELQVRALSGEGRATAWVLLATPIFLFIMLSWRTPENMALFVASPTGRALLSGAAGGMIIGYFWIRKLVNIRY